MNHKTNVFRQGLPRRLFAFLLTVSMVFTMIPPVTAAGVTDSGKILLSGFAQLPEPIREQSVPLGTSLEELNLPDTLEATVEAASVDAGAVADTQLEEPKDSGAATLPTEEQTDHGTSDEPAAKGEIIEDNDVPLLASPSDTEDKDDADAGADKTVIISGITWESDPLYDNETEGTYIFTAVLPSGYTVEDGIAMPEITVVVGQAGQTAVDKVIALIDALPAMDEWTEMDDAAARAVMDEILAAKRAYDALTDEEKAQIEVTRTAKLTELAELAQQLAGIMPMATSGGNLDFTWDGTPAAGDGYVWVKDTKTLTLTDFDHTSSSYIGIQLPDGATLVLNGTNSLTVTGKNGLTASGGGNKYANYGILCGNYDSSMNPPVYALTIEGSGTLAVTCAYTGTEELSHSWGMMAESITVNSGIVTCTGDKATYTTGSTSIGVLAEDAITINGGSLSGISGEATGDNYGVYTENGSSITVKSGGTLTGTGEIGVLANNLTVGGGSVVGVGKGGALRNSGVTVNSDLIINSGSLTGTAEDSSDMSVGVAVANTFTVNGGTITATSGTAAVSGALMSINLPTLGAGIVTKCNSGGNTDYTDEVNFAMNNGISMYVVFEGADQTTIATDVKIYKALPPGLLDNPLTQEKVDLAFGTGNATLAGNTITLNNSIVVNNTTIFDGVTATLDLNGETITGAKGADSSTSAAAKDGLDAVLLRNSAQLTVNGTTDGSAIIGGGGGHNTGTARAGVGGRAILIAYNNAGHDNRLTMQGGTLQGGQSGKAKQANRGIGGDALYSISPATITLSDMTLQGGSADGVVMATGGDGLEILRGTCLLTNVTAIGGAKGYGDVHGNAVSCGLNTKLTIDGGIYRGHYGLHVATDSQVEIRTGEFTTLASDISGNKPISIGNRQGSTPIKNFILDKSCLFITKGGTAVTRDDLTAPYYEESIVITDPVSPVTINVNKDNSAWSGHGKTFKLSADGGSNFITDLTQVHNGTYTVYEDSTSTGVTVTVNGGAQTATVDYYTVTLNGNGGTGTVLSPYIYGVGATLPIDWTKTGYAFKGWCDNSDLTGSAVTTISATDTGSKEYWAKWEGASVSGVSLNKTSTTLVTGQTEALTATVLPANAANKSVTWGSSNTGVATVADGTVTAVDAGTATITVTTVDGGKTATCAVTINKNDGQIVAAAKTAAENADYAPTTQTAIDTESAAQTYVQNIATTAVNNSGVTVTVNKMSYTTPVAGTSFDRDGTNGSYTFTITVSKGAQSQTTVQITVVITATPYSGGGSTGGGDSADGGTPPPTSKPTESVTGNTESKATVDDQGNASVSITDKNIADAIANAKASAHKNGVNAGEIKAVINVTTGGKEATTISVNLPKVVQEQVIDNKIAKVELVIDRPDLTIGMNLSVVTEINRQANSDVQISASKTDAAALSAEAKDAIGNRPAFDLKVTCQSDGKSVTNFGTGAVSVEIPYKLQSGESAGNICAAYVDANGKVTYLTSSSYDAQRETLVFTTNHFSVYGVGFKATSSKFTDTANHWAKDSIDFVVSRGLMNGTSETTFSPNDAMTRGMLVTALGRLAGADVSDYKVSSFSDVSADSYYMGYIEWANKNNIAVGVGEGKFAPDALVTREQMAVIMDRYTAAIGFTLPEVHAFNTFADNTKIGTGAVESVKRIQMAGIIRGKTGNVFAPQDTATRAEVSAVIKGFVELAAFSNTAQGWTMNDSGTWMYYENGKPVTGTRNIDGATYTFNSLGELANTP